jgi:hypothetical protein
MVKSLRRVLRGLVSPSRGKAHEAKRKRAKIARAVSWPFMISAKTRPRETMKAERRRAIRVPKLRSSSPKAKKTARRKRTTPRSMEKTGRTLAPKILAQPARTKVQSTWTPEAECSPSNTNPFPSERFRATTNW